MTKIIVVLIAAAAQGQTVRLTPYPQKMRTFHEAADSRVPAMPGLQVRTPEGVVWSAEGDGIVRRDERAAPRDRLQYFAGRRYLPEGKVTGLARDAAGGIWVRTASGVSHIEMRRMTLAEKAGLFEQRIRERHDRHGLVGSSRLRVVGDLTSNVTESSDNDGLWTAMYAAGECFRYAATHSPEALANARRAIAAILFLEEITGLPGFPARSYVDVNEQRPGDGVWYPAPGGKMQWKADTSSDEIVGHFFIFGLAWDLLPAGDPLRGRVAATARRIMDHIIDHGYLLVDVTGKPTTWGKWTQEYFDTPGGRPDSPLNAIELLSFLKTAHHITQDERYDREYRKLAIDRKYAELGTRQLELCPEINYSDEELAMLSFYPLFIYEKDERYLNYDRRAADAWWKNIQRELNPLWTFIYALGRPSSKLDFDGAAWTLYRIPMDLVEWTVDNSKRPGIVWEQGADRFRQRQLLTLLPPDERPVGKWNSNVFRAEGGNGGRGEDDGAFFLLPYWMGRYHGFLTGE